MNFANINALTKQLAEKRPLATAELKRLRDEFIVENTYNSNAIEGNTLTLCETALVLKGVTIGEKPLKDHLEAIGHKEAFEYVYELADRNTELTERVIKDLHALVLMNDRENKGKYRSVQVRILGAKHTPPPPYLVAEHLTKLLTDYAEIKANRHIIEAVAEFHLRFEGIHPFIDGNGRTGRLILNLELIKSGLLPINIKYADRRRYYDCFDEYHDEQKTIEPLVKLIAEYEEVELKKRIELFT